jgi:hypothetical protein
LRQTYHRLSNHFVLILTRLKWKLVLVHLEIVLIFTQDRCTVYAEYTIVSAIILDAPD